MSERPVGSVKRLRRDFHFACPGWHRYTPDRRRAHEILFVAQSSSSRDCHSARADVRPTGAAVFRAFLRHWSILLPFLRPSSSVSGRPLSRKVRLMGRGPVSAGRVSQVISGHAACATVSRSHVRWLGEPPLRRSDRVSPGGESGPPGAPGPSAASPDRCPTPSTRRARPETRTARLDAGRRHRHA